MPENEVSLFKVTRTRLITEVFRIRSQDDESAIKAVGDNDEHENNPFAERLSEDREVIKFITEKQR
jgi:hypothetical protein